MPLRLLYILLLTVLSVPVCAQTFEVRSFKLLQNDITAYVSPVKDLNEEACALIKVVGDRDFVFSTPLGVVLRKEQTGEIWVYVPKDTRKITVKHPRWGVLRDYAFPAKLESRLTYELVLSPPVSRDPLSSRLLRIKLPMQHPEVAATFIPTMLPAPKNIRPKRPKEPLRYITMLNVSMSNTDFSGGAMVGVMRRHGIYVRGITNFNSLSTSLEADKNGVLKDSQSAPYYTGNTYRSRYSITAGGMHRLFRSFYIYEGIGYGERTIAWETVEGERVEIGDYSHQGAACDAGVLWRGKRWAFSAGALTVNTSYWELLCGIGIHF